MIYKFTTDAQTAHKLTKESKKQGFYFRTLRRTGNGLPVLCEINERGCAYIGGGLNFSVDVIGYNVNVFRDNYAEYIKNEQEGYFENVIFDLNAPKEIYEEIDDLKEECIYIQEKLY